MKASEYKRAPSGLLLPLHATLSGRVRWQVLDERGVPEVPRSPSGFALGPVEGVEQPNLITDLGLDQVAAYRLNGLSDTSSETWRRYLAVGTGSAAPDVTDTALDNEVQRAASSGTFPTGSNSTTLDDDLDVWRHTSTVTRLVTMTADRNLTEFGFSPVSSGAIGIRELLRDSEGTPIAVSLLNGKTLRVDHTLIVELPAPEEGIPATINIEEYDAGNNLVNTIPQDVVHGGVRDTNGNLVFVNSPFTIWDPAGPRASTFSGVIEGSEGTSVQPNVAAITVSQAYARQWSSPPSNTSGSASLTAQPYVSASHQRISRFTFSTGEANQALYGFIFTGWRFSSRRGGYVVMLDDPASYTKKDTDTLRVGIISTWARA